MGFYLGQGQADTGADDFGLGAIYFGGKFYRWIETWAHRLGG